MKLSAAAMKYSNQFFQHDILKYIKSEVMDNSNFFKRRLYLSFLEHCIELFSVGYLTEIGILTNFSNFLTFTDTYDANKLTIQKALNLLKYFLPFISVEKTNDNLNFAIFNKLSYIRKYQKDQEVLKVNYLLILFRVFLNLILGMQFIRRILRTVSTKNLSKMIA